MVLNKIKYLARLFEKLYGRKVGIVKLKRDEMEFHFDYPLQESKALKVKLEKGLRGIEESIQREVNLVRSKHLKWRMLRKLWLYQTRVGMPVNGEIYDFLIQIADSPFVSPEDFKRVLRTYRNLGPGYTLEVPKVGKDGKVDLSLVRIVPITYPFTPKQEKRIRENASFFEEGYKSPEEIKLMLEESEEEELYW